jgi:predicted dehydrogenase
MVSAATRYWGEDVRGETFTTLTIQFSGGTVGTMVSNWHSLTIPECRLRVDGTKGSLLSVKRSITSDQYTLTVHQMEGEAEGEDCSRQNAFTLAMGESMKRLLQAISNGSQPPHSGRDNLETMAIVDAAYLSASHGGAKIEINT